MYSHSRLESANALPGIADAADDKAPAGAIHFRLK
jgi:hypothetical protein